MSCNAYECDEIGHMFFYSAFRQIYENMASFLDFTLQVYDMNVEQAPLHFGGIRSKALPEMKLQVASVYEFVKSATLIRFVFFVVLLEMKHLLTISHCFPHLNLAPYCAKQTCTKGGKPLCFSTACR